MMALVTMLLPLVVVAGIGIVTFRTSIGALEEFREEMVDETKTIEEARDLLARADDLGEEYAEKGDPAVGERFTTLSRRLDRTFDEFRTLSTRQERDLASAAGVLWKQVGVDLGEAASLPPGPRVDQALDPFHDHLDEAGSVLADLLSLNSSQVADEISSLRSREQLQLLAALTTLVVGLSIAALLARVVRRSIASPLLSLEEAATRFGADDFSYQVPVGGDDELARVGSAFNAMAGKLQKSRDEQERMEAELERLAAFPKLSPAPVLELGRGATVEYANQSAVALAHAVGDGDVRSILPTRVLELVRDCLASGRKRTEEIQVGERTLAWSLVPIAGSGSVRRYGEDIGQRKAAEEALKPEAELNGHQALRDPLAGLPDRALLRDRVHCYGEDITDRRRAEEALRRSMEETEAARELFKDQNEELRQLDRMKDEFVASVTHELRTPLTSIQGYMELLVTGEAGEVNEEQRRYLEVIDRNAARLLTLVNDLLLVAQINDERLHLETQLLDLGALAEQSVESARPHARDKDIQLIFEPPLGVAVVGDPGRLGQVVDNLVSNAIKFTPPGGLVTVGLEAGKAGATLEVRDTGMGMAPADVKRLFTRFFRTSQATEHAIPGTGLGLSISKAIIDAHGGEIGVESEQGAGSSFRITLPWASLRQTDASRATAAKS